MNSFLCSPEKFFIIVEGRVMIYTETLNRCNEAVKFVSAEKVKFDSISEDKAGKIIAVYSSCSNVCSELIDLFVVEARELEKAHLVDWDYIKQIELKTVALKNNLLLLQKEVKELQGELNELINEI